MLLSITSRYVPVMLIVAMVTLRAAAEEAGSGAVTELHGAYERLDADYRGALEHLSHVAFARGWSQLGEAARGWQPAAPESGSRLFVAADQYTDHEAAISHVADNSSGERQPWLDQFAELRRQQAESLFQLAKQAADVGQLSLAFQWATEAVREYPDHSEARRVLGYEERDGRWLTRYGLRMADAGKVWHPKFGWVAEADVPRYEAGERRVGSRWRSADDDAERHKDIKSGWQVRTDHFLVTTDHSLEAAAELCARLERLHQVWRQLFAGFYLTEGEVRRLFAGDREPRRQVRPFRVYYHRDSAAYAAALRARQPRIAATLGIYFDRDNEAHFFAGEQDHLPTLYHEAVHQLFQESKPVARQIGSMANFWIVEGVAAYFETLAEHSGGPAGLYYTIGQTTAGRLPSARGQLAEGFYLPLAELTQLGKDDLQRHPDLAKVYSQATGLTAFLMDGQQARYREALVRYLEAVYAGRDTPQSLTDAAGLDYDELDAQYRRSMQSLP